MTFVKTVDDSEAQGAVADMYEGYRTGFGHLPNMARLFSLHPEVNAGWTALVGVIRANMELRRYEIATLAAARALGSSYCMLAHGKVLMREGMSAETLMAVAEGREDPGITDQEAAIMNFAARIATDAGSVTQADVDGLRNLGLSDAEIFDVAATAAVRCFFSKLLDALGAEPDAAYRSLERDLRDALTVGRQIEAGESQTPS